MFPLELEEYVHEYRLFLYSQTKAIDFLGALKIPVS